VVSKANKTQSKADMGEDDIWGDVLRV